MKYNDTIDVEFRDISESWYVEVDDVKQALNLLFETEGSYDFSDDDVYLQELIHQAREILEQYTGIGFTKGTVTAILRNECGDIELPYGPLRSSPVFTDKDGTVITDDVTLRGNLYQWIECPKLDYIKAVYNGGFDPAGDSSFKFPLALKRAWIEQCVWMYKNRGESGTVCEQALNTAAPYKRKSWVQ